MLNTTSERAVAPAMCHHSDQSPQKETTIINCYRATETFSVSAVWCRFLIPPLDFVTRSTESHLHW